MLPTLQIWLAAGRLLQPYFHQQSLDEKCLYNPSGKPINQLNPGHTIETQEELGQVKLQKIE